MQYGLLFRIECLHAYFGWEACRSLTLVPTSDCRLLMARYQLIFREAAGGGEVYGPPDLLKQFDETAAFTFALTTTDPLFNSYTDLNLDKLDLTESIFHFDNRKDYQAAIAGQQRQLLHEPSRPFTQGALSVRPKISSLPSPAAGGQFSVLEPLGLRSIVQGAFPANGASASLDLRKSPEGLYLLQIGKNPSQEFYLSDELAVRRWGVISIYAGGLRQAGELPDNCTVIDSSGLVHSRTFTLALESRSTVWRYYVIPSGDRQNFGDYQVVSAGKKPADSSVQPVNDFSFALLPGTTTIEGRNAWVFQSNSAFPFLLSPANSFALSLRPNKNGQSGQRAIRLPYARPASLVRDETVAGKMRSEVFVYL